MSSQQMNPLDDPVVREVREIRARIWKEAGGTVEGLIRLIRETSKDTMKPKRKKKRNSR